MQTFGKMGTNDGAGIFAFALAADPSFDKISNIGLVKMTRRQAPTLKL